MIKKTIINNAKMVFFVSVNIASNETVKTTISATCQSCKLPVTITYDGPKISNLKVSGTINFDGITCNCGGKFSAPGGEYVKDEKTGVLNRVGDYVEVNP